MGLMRAFCESALCLVISQVFNQVYLSIYRVYLDSVTIASYYILLIGLCHKNVVTNIEVWCYPYPPDCQHVTQNDFKQWGPPTFFRKSLKHFTFSFFLYILFYLFFYKLNCSTP